MGVLLEGGLNLPMPRVIPIRQKFSTSKIQDIAEEVKSRYYEFPEKNLIKAGDRIAVAVGSRGVNNIALIVKTLVNELKEQGAKPFIVPAMGSHGGATAEGQTKVLMSYGIDQERIGAPVVSSMEVVEIGKLSDGMPVVIDRHALNSDGIIVINRIKPHTSYKAEIESGLLKMMTIGLGKHKGATLAHECGFEVFPQLLQSYGQIVMGKTPFLFGVAVIENAFDETAVIEFVSKQKLIDREKELLVKAKELMPKLYIKDIDVLIVQEMGKEISGAGIDPNITGRSASLVFDRKYIDAPQIKRIVILSLTEKTNGNATGLGVGDVITRRLYDSINFDYTYANIITATILGAGKIPVIMPTDYDAIQVALRACNRIKHPKSKIVWIKNTMMLEYLYVSETYANELKENPNIEVLDDPEPLQFDKYGVLIIDYDKYYSSLSKPE